MTDTRSADEDALRRALAATAALAPAPAYEPERIGRQAVRGTVLRAVAVAAVVAALAVGIPLALAGRGAPAAGQSAAAPPPGTPFADPPIGAHGVVRAGVEIRKILQADPMVAGHCPAGELRTAPNVADCYRLGPALYLLGAGATYSVRYNRAFGAPYVVISPAGAADRRRLAAATGTLARLQEGVAVVVGGRTVVGHPTVLATWSDIQFSAPAGSNILVLAAELGRG